MRPCPCRSSWDQHRSHQGRCGDDPLLTDPPPTALEEHPGAARAPGAAPGGDARRLRRALPSAGRAARGHPGRRPPPLRRAVGQPGARGPDDHRASRAGSTTATGRSSRCRARPRWSSPTTSRSPTRRPRRPRSSPLVGVPVRQADRPALGAQRLRRRQRGARPRGGPPGRVACSSPGIVVQSSSVRTYPNGPIATSVIGGTNATGAGSAGLEYEYQSMLAGQSGVTRAFVSRRGVNLPSSHTTVISRGPARGRPRAHDRHATAVRHRARSGAPARPRRRRDGRGDRHGRQDRRDPGRRVAGQHHDQRRGARADARVGPARRRARGRADHQQPRVHPGLRAGLRLQGRDLLGRPAGRPRSRRRPCSRSPNSVERRRALLPRRRAPRARAPHRDADPRATRRTSAPTRSPAASARPGCSPRSSDSASARRRRSTSPARPPGCS